MFVDELLLNWKARKIIINQKIDTKRTCVPMAYDQARLHT